MKVYIATSLENREQAESFRARLESVGIQVTSNWSKDPGNTRDREHGTTTEQWSELAEVNYNAIDEAGHLVFICSPTGKGSIAEVAYAKGKNYPHICVGNPRDTTLMLANYPWVSNLDVAYKWVVKMAGVAA